LRVKDTKGREHPFNIGNYVVSLNDTRPRSDLHLRARAILKAEYQTDVILEEVPVPGEHLFLDFFLPLRKLVIEVHGEQHYRFNSFFHTSKQDFLASKQNDRRKQQWAEINNFSLTVLPYDERDEQWLERIRQA
jgi:hypothetical protein